MANQLNTPIGPMSRDILRLRHRTAAQQGSGVGAIIASKQSMGSHCSFLQIISSWIRLSRMESCLLDFVKLWQGISQYLTLAGCDIGG